MLLAGLVGDLGGGEFAVSVVIVSIIQLMAHFGTKSGAIKYVLRYF